jgi:CheY-like chemotaxis protein
MSTLDEAEATPKTILVVEDNGAARIALEAILDALGYHVLMTASGPEALVVFRSQPDTIDLVMSDMFMPDMTGPELYDLLKVERPSVPMLIMSGYPMEDERERLEQHGIQHWIQKPFSMRQLEDRIRGAMNSGA